MDEQPFNLEEVVYKSDVKFLAAAYKDLQTQIEDLKAVTIQDLKKKVEEQALIIQELVLKTSSL